jgi:predicted metalloendopeptidase
MQKTAETFDAQVCQAAKARVDKLLGAANGILKVNGYNDGVVGLKVYVCGGRGHVDDFEWDDDLNRLWTRKMRLEFDLAGDQIKKNAWPMSGNEVNAVYVPNQDAVFVMGALLQPPFFDAHWSEELMVAGIDFIIAHEIGHAIDFRVNDTRLKHLIVQKLEAVANDQKQLVDATSSEDVADYYGMKIVETVSAPTMTSFYHFAQLFCSKNDSFSGDVHAPGPWRVNQTVGLSSHWKAHACS